MGYRIKNKTKRQELIQLYNQFSEERSNIDILRIQFDIGLDERMSAKGLFEIAHNTLKQAIAERLKNGQRSYSSRRGE